MKITKILHYKNLALYGTMKNQTEIISLKSFTAF